MLRQCLCCLACISLLPGLASGDVLPVISSAAYNTTAHTITIKTPEQQFANLLADGSFEAEARTIRRWLVTASALP
jgi:hypothetical protein